MKIEVKVVNYSSNPLPEYADNGCSGCDIRANLDLVKGHLYDGAAIYQGKQGLKLVMPPGSRALIPSGLHVNIPEGYEIQVRGRSGLALKHGIMISNGIGTIDESYTGDIGVILYNSGSEDFIIEHGDRIAQLVLMQVPKIKWVPVETLDETERGEGGFGHTGV